MGFFDDIKSRIFGKDAVPAPTTPAPDVEAARKAAEAIGQAAAAKVAAASAVEPAPVTVASASPEATATAAPTPTQAVDVAAVLDAAVAESGQKLNWKTSIVDLLKALDLDSSLSARKTLAAELGYTGDTSDSATMNIWLHKQVLAKLADNGGKVPDTLLA